MKIILVGYGNVGKELHKVLLDKKLAVDLIVRNNGIYDSNFSKIADTSEFHNFVGKDSIVFISTPSTGKGELSAPYYIKSSDKEAIIITCEKAYIANNWDFIKKYSHKIRYSATVGGGSGILNAVTEHKDQIEDIRAVINGTLNYIGDKLAQGIDKAEIYKEVVEKGFAEPGSNDFYEVIENELKDVLHKTTILANHSNLYDYVINPESLIVEPYKNGLRCSVLLNKEKITAGFIPHDNDSWFPEGVNNVLYINNKKIIENLGAGGKTTAEMMFKDFDSLQ